MNERTQQKTVIAMTLAFALVYVAGTAASSGLSLPLVQGDAKSYFAYLPSLVLDFDLDLRNQFTQLRPEQGAGGDAQFPFGPGAGDKAANPFPVGPALLWLPGYLAGLALDAIAGAIGFDTGPLGYGLFAVWGAALCAIALAGVGVELSRRLAAEVVEPRYSLAAALLIWLGTPALYYTMVAPLYSHAVAWFAVALATWLGWLAFRDSDTWWRWLVAGAAGGLLVSIRLQDAPLLLVPLILLLLSNGGGTKLARSAAAWSAGALLAYLPQAYVWYSLHGEWIPRQNLGAPRSASLQRLFEVLFSSGYEGWLSWTPLAVVALAGLGWLALTARSPAQRSVAWMALVAIAALVLIDVIHPYGQGAAFGARRYVSATSYLAVGLAAAISWCAPKPRYRTVGFTAIGALALANLWLFVAYELLIFRHGVYGSLAVTWRYALGAWAG